MTTKSKSKGSGKTVLRSWISRPYCNASATRVTVGNGELQNLGHARPSPNHAAALDISVFSKITVGPGYGEGNGSRPRATDTIRTNGHSLGRQQEQLDTGDHDIQRIGHFPGRTSGKRSRTTCAGGGGASGAPRRRWANSSSTTAPAARVTVR